MMRAEIAPRLAQLGLAPEPATDGGGVRVAPRTLQEAADVLGHCSREGWRVRLAGAGTRGRPTAPFDLEVSSQRLAGLDVYEPDDLTAGVLAGTSHAALDATLAAHRQLLPLDPFAGDDATLGGTFAAAAAGPLRAGYGTPRDFALGLHAVTGDGRVLRLGGQVVKNVAGYDLVRLLVGSRGTLAFIGQVHVRLRSLPGADATLLAGVRDAAEAAALALELRDAVHPVALEVLGARGGEPWRLALRLHGSTAVIDDAEQRVRTRLPDVARLAPEAAAAFWAGLRRLEAGAATRLRLRARTTESARLLELAGRITATDPAGWSLAAHGADGIVRLCHPASPGDPARLEPLLAAVRAELLGSGGACICEAGPPGLRAAAPPPEPAAAVLRLESELRRRFDPAAILVGD